MNPKGRGLAVAGALGLCATHARAEPLEVAGDGGEPGPSVAVEASVASRCKPRSSNCRRSAARRSGVSLFGLRGSESKVTGVDTKPGLTLSSSSSTRVTDAESRVSLRAQHFALFGGGRGGVEGGIGVDLAIGLSERVGEWQTLFSRLGGRGFLLGNGAFYASLVELPSFELGYQWLDRVGHFELAPRVGPVLAGRYHPSDERRRLGAAFEWGGHASVGTGGLLFELAAFRVEAGDGQPGPVDLVQGQLCGGARFLGACLDVRAFRGRARAQGEPAQVLTFGVTVGSYAAEPLSD